jgi:hypothetical protein
MKRTILIAMLAVGLIAGAVGYAGAEADDVVVTARVNPAFSFGIAGDTVNWLGINLGSTYSSTAPVLTVKSNKAWNFTKEIPVIDAAIAPFMTETTSLDTTTGASKGVRTITTSYELNLTGDAAYDIDPGVDYTATYTYTAVQQ